MLNKTSLGDLHYVSMLNIELDTVSIRPTKCRARGPFAHCQVRGLVGNYLMLEVYDLWVIGQVGRRTRGCRACT